MSAATLRMFLGQFYLTWTPRVGGLLRVLCGVSNALLSSGLDTEHFSDRATKTSKYQAHAAFSSANPKAERKRCKSTPESSRVIQSRVTSERTVKESARSPPVRRTRSLGSDDRLATLTSSPDGISPSQVKAMSQDVLSRLHLFNSVRLAYIWPIVGLYYVPAQAHKSSQRHQQLNAMPQGKPSPTKDFQHVDSSVSAQSPSTHRGWQRAQGFEGVAKSKHEQTSHCLKCFFLNFPIRLRHKTHNNRGKRQR